MWRKADAFQGLAITMCSFSGVFLNALQIAEFLMNREGKLGGAQKLGQGDQNQRKCHRSLTCLPISSYSVQCGVEEGGQSLPSLVLFFQVAASGQWAAFLWPAESQTLPSSEFSRSEDSQAPDAPLTHRESHTRSRCPATLLSSLVISPTGS